MRGVCDTFGDLHLTPRAAVVVPNPTPFSFRVCTATVAVLLYDRVRGTVVMLKENMFWATTLHEEGEHCDDV